MRLRLVGATLAIGGLCVLGFAQTSTHPAHRSNANPAEQSKASVSKSQYLNGPFDPSATHLTPQFKGNDIVAITERVKGASALAPKSEYETTQAYEARKASFRPQTALGYVAPGSYLAFVIETEPMNSNAGAFRYDADASTMTAKLNGYDRKFYLDRNQPDMQTVSVRSILQSTEKYIASNAFGAKVEVTDMYVETYGLSFSPSSWVFEGSGHALDFARTITMTPELASKVKGDLRFLIVCRLQEPWYLHSAIGHDAKIDDPIKLIEGLNFLHVDPEQIWIVDVRTGEVLRKFTQASIEADKAGELKAQLREFPLIVELSANNVPVTLKVRLDDGEEKVVAVYRDDLILRAKTKVVLRWSVPRGISDLTLTVNGKPYKAQWQTKETIIGTHRVIDEATVTVRTQDVNDHPSED